MQQREAAALALALAQTDVETARAAVHVAEQQLAEAHLGPTRVEAKRHEVAAMRAAVDQAAAALADVRSIVADFRITSPLSGTVLTRFSDVGEVVAPGAPLLTLVDLDRLYLKVYVPEPLIGRVHLGLPARVYTDAFPDQPFAATVRYIAARAEFTPKDVQTVDERAKLVYAVKLYLEANPGHRLTPGVPADAIIQYDPEAPWAPPRR